MRTTRSDYEYDDLPDLPSYSDSEAAAASSGHATQDPDAEEAFANGIVTDQYEIIRGPSGWQRSSDNAEGREVSIRMHEGLDKDSEALCDYVTRYIRMVPPRPKICIHGSHYETIQQKDKKERKLVTDFDFSFNLSAFLPSPKSDSSRPHDQQGYSSYVAANSDSTYRGSWRKTCAPGYKQGAIQLDDVPPPQLREWCEDYCNSKSSLKVFRISREVTGLDHGMLKSQIESLIRHTNYRGRISITFPIEERYVDIYSQHWINRWRISWVRWLFYLSFLWIFTWPVLFFMTKWWTVYTVHWRFSWRVSEGTQYGKISESRWIEKYGKLVQGLAVKRYTGDATNLPTNAGEEVRSENANVNAAVDFLRSGVQVWNAVSRGSGDITGWGYDT